MPSKKTPFKIILSPQARAALERLQRAEAEAVGESVTLSDTIRALIRRAAAGNAPSTSDTNGAPRLEIR